MTLRDMADDRTLFEALLHDRELIGHGPSTTPLGANEHLAPPRRHGLRFITIHST